MRKAVIGLTLTAFLYGGMILFQACAGGGDSTTSSSNGDSAQITNADTATPVYSGYSTGTDIFADLLKLLVPGAALVNVNAAFSGAAASSTATLSTINNEMGHAVVPSDLETAAQAPIGTFNSYGRGSGLEVGVGTTLPNNPDVNQLILAGMAEQAASPVTPAGNQPDGSVAHLIGPVPADPLAFASVLSGNAKAQFDPARCTVDPENLAFGRGDAADVEVINTGVLTPLGNPNSQPLVATTNSQPTSNTVSSSKSQVHLVANGDVPDNFGLLSETMEEIAPVILFKGTPNQTVIEIAGQWALQALATGSASTSILNYGPTFSGVPAAPTTPLITITPPGGAPQIVLKTQDLFGPSAIPQHIFIPPGPAPHLAEISVGEDPRKIGDDNTDTPAAPTISDTEVSGAVDIVRITILSGLALPDDHVAEIRIGHMESKALVPAGGVNCPPTGTPTVTGTPGTPTPTTTGTPGTATPTPTSTRTPGGGGGGAGGGGAGGGGAGGGGAGGGGAGGGGGGNGTPSPRGTGTPPIGLGTPGIGFETLITTGSGGCSLGGNSAAPGSEMMPAFGVGLLLAVRQWRKRSRKRGD